MTGSEHKVFSSIYYPCNHHTTHHILSNIICMLEYIRTNIYRNKYRTARIQIVLRLVFKTFTLRVI